MAAHAVQPDRRLFFWLSAGMLLLIVVASVIAPSTENNDPRPSTRNSAPGGAKAAYLLLQSLGTPVARWEQPLEQLRNVDAAHTTLVVAAPMYTALDKDRLTAAVKSFLERGGRLVTTGPTGALLIPGGSVAPSRRFAALCYTQPEGPGALAAAGQVEMSDVVRWAEEKPDVRVEQRCGEDAVVVRVPAGRGEAIWWSTARPMTNAELRKDGDLKLFLASVGAGRRVLFDESLHEPVPSQWTAARGLPLWWMLGQGGLVFGLLVFSFSRRRGPVRLPVAVPRSSPVEFAVSMGDLYERAGATGAAIDAARRRLGRVLLREGGLSQQLLDAGPDAVAAALKARFGGDWTSLGEHLRTAAAAREAKSGSALALVRALAEDVERVQRAGRPATPGVGTQASGSAREAGRVRELEQAGSARV